MDTSLPHVGFFKFSSLCQLFPPSWRKLPTTFPVLFKLSGTASSVHFVVLLVFVLVFGYLLICE